MPDNHLLEDEATLYVLGHLTDAERAEFETQLAQSAELRALVHELEEGTVALAAAVPQRRPPSQVWRQIERTVAEETRRKVVTPSFWTGWLHNGWAAAAACLVGWLLYAVWVNRADPSGVSPAHIISEAASQPGVTNTDFHATEAGGVTRQPSTMTNASQQLLQVNPPAPTREIGVLRWQIVELENHATQLSQALTQHQALLAEPSRAKFFQLVPTSDGSAGTNFAAPSPELQRALFLAMARELGWTRSTDSTSEPKPDANAGSGQESQTSHSNPTQTNQSGVDFVNMQPATNQPANPQPQTEAASGDTHSQTEVASADTPESASLVNFAPTSAIPGFVAGTNMFLAFGSSVVPAGSQLTFWIGTPDQWSPLGTATAGNDSTVLTIPLGIVPASATFASGFNLSVTATTAAGQSNGIRYSVPIAPQP